MPGARTGPPSPDEATTPAEYVAALRALREWSGLTYRQLAAKAEASGDVLPSSTIASALSRSTLSRQQVVATFVRACGLDDAAAARWIAVRNHLAAGPITTTPPPSAKEAEEAVTAQRTAARPAEPASPPATAARRRRPRAAITVTALLVVVGVAAVLVWNGTHDSGNSTSTPPPWSAPLADGWYLIRPAHIGDLGLCLGEGRERNGRTDRPLAVQRPCDRVSPDTYLKAVGVEVYEIQWHHPVEGAGCLTVDGAYTGDGALLAPTDCMGAAHQRYLLERVDVPVLGGYRLRPIHSGLCVGMLGGSAEVNTGAEAVQTNCTGAGDQEFLIASTQRASRPS